MLRSTFYQSGSSNSLSNYSKPQVGC